MFQNLLKNGNFQNGTLSPWRGSNVYIEPKSSPNMPKAFNLILKGKKANASIEQSIDVVPGEIYDITISAAAKGWGISPPIKILLEYFDSSGKRIKDGINFSISKGRLANWNSHDIESFKTIHQNSLKVPANASWGKLTIIKIASPHTTNVIIDTIVLTRSEDKISLNTKYVESIEDDILSIVEADPIEVAEESSTLIQVDQDTDQYIYVVNEDGVLSIIQASDNSIVENVDLTGKFSYQENQNILVGSNGSTVSTSNQSSSTTQDYITMVDPSTNSLITTIELDDRSVTLVLTNDSQPNYGLLYIINHDNSSVSVIDTSTNEIIDNFELDIDNQL
ncbi:NTTRR-F1 domain [Wukongibacter baidiensis]|uniref:NTTRR-F1 domain n=1 Tax=Wukongibacter baidiensis TaxID=1723361 RepID=UPI003D7F9452